MKIIKFMVFLGVILFAYFGCGKEKHIEEEKTAEKGEKGDKGDTGASGATGSSGLSISSIWAYNVSGDGHGVGVTDISGAQAASLKVQTLRLTIYSDGSYSLTAQVSTGLAVATCSLPFKASTSEQSDSCRVYPELLTLFKVTATASTTPIVKAVGGPYFAGYTASDTSFTLTKTQ